MSNEEIIKQVQQELRERVRAHAAKFIADNNLSTKQAAVLRGIGGVREPGDREIFMSLTGEEIAAIDASDLFQRYKEGKRLYLQAWKNGNS